MKSSQICFSLMLLFLMVAFFSGCGETSLQTKFKAANKNNIEKIANAYRMFASINRNIGPKDEEEFKNFLRTDARVAPRLGLSSLDLNNLDSYFTSEADNEPFVVLYGQKIKPDLDWSAIAFDKTGVNGMRRIALACNVVIEVSDDKQYARILAGNIKKKDVPAHVFGGGIDESVEAGLEP